MQKKVAGCSRIIGTDAETNTFALVGAPLTQYVTGAVRGFPRYWNEERGRKVWEDLKNDIENPTTHGELRQLQVDRKDGVGSTPEHYCYVVYKYRYKEFRYRQGSRDHKLTHASEYIRVRNGVLDFESKRRGHEL